MHYEDDIEQKDFRKRKEKSGIKGYVLLVILGIVITAAFFMGVFLRDSLPSIPFLEKPVPVQAAPPVKEGMTLN